MTCAPRWDGTETVIDVRPSWVPVAEKLVAVGRRRHQLPHPSPQRRDEQEKRDREKIWGEIQRICYGPAKKVAMPASVAMQLLGLSRQAYYDILSHQVGPNPGPPAARGAAYIRAWAREHGIEVPNHGPIPIDVMLAYREAMGITR